MFGFSFLDIAIGVAFVFLLLSLIASTLNEIILSFLNMRGKELLCGLKTLLDDDDGTGLVKDLYNHGQIFGLFKGDFNPKKTGNLPSYIPSENFVMALLDVVPEAVSKEPVVETRTAASLDSLRKAAQKLAEDAKTEKVGKPLVSMIDVAGDDIGKLKKSLENWFNSAMDRVSGWYKYRTQWMLFGIGLVLAATLNADTIRIVKQLSRDPTLRQSIVAAAQSAKPSDNKGGESIKDQIQQAQTEISNIQSIGIPLGWAGTPRPSSYGEWLQVSGGWLLTAIAISLGAPFWFDMLNKIIVVRSTVKPREKSREEESKDKQKK